MRTRDRLHTVAALAGLLLVSLACLRSKEDTAREKRAEKAAEEEKAKEQAKLDALFRQQCHIKDGGVVFSIYEDDLKDQCRAHVDKTLKVPGSGIYPLDEDKTTGMVTEDGCTRIFNSYVVAQNAFGVKVKTNYTCTYDPRTSIITVR